jgi:poly(3-hydroxybutyrate) depolymerase
MKNSFLSFLILCWTVSFVSGAEPTELREWHATSGHKVEAKALQVAQGKVQLKRANGTKVVVPLDKFTEEDQELLREHFGLGGPDEGSGESDAPPAGEAADDLPHPLGATTEEISCGDDFSYFLYLPESLRKGAKHPVLFIMSPGGGSKGAVKRYQKGADRNRWILAVSKQSKNGFDGSQAAIDSMIAHVTSKLPIDEKRMYTTGFSGGSRMAYATSQVHKEIAGVLGCGAGGNLGSTKQVSYGLCGTNCFNRTDMANSFKGFKSKDCVLRYFPGKHAWAGEELCDDAITHLNGVFLAKNRDDYPDDYADYVREVSSLIDECAGPAPMRAYMWTSFLTEHKVTAPKLAGTHATLGEDDMNTLYVKGLTEINEFAQKTFGKVSASQWQADPKVSSACKREAGKYAGTPWEGVLNLMAEDAQKF